MKDWILRATVVIALVVLALVLRRRDAGVDLPATPSDTVRQLFDAAEAGDVKTYLGLLRDEPRATMEYKLQEIGSDAFRADLKKSMRDVKGLSLETQETGSRSAVVRATLVFVDRNETQEFQLAREDSGWGIVEVNQAALEIPPRAYGTPVFGTATSEPGQRTP